MSTTGSVISKIGYGLNKKFTEDSEPTKTEILSWINDTIQWITVVLAENESELGRTLGTVTTIKKAITAITQAAAGQVTSTTHGLDNGESVLIKSVVGMIEVNDLWHTVAASAASTFTIESTLLNTAYSSSGYIYKATYDDLASILWTPATMGWIQDTYDRNPIYLGTEEDSIQYSPSEVAQPEKFYLDGSNNVVFLPTPDAAYTIRIPYWAIQTVIDEEGETMPFGGMLDMLIVDSVILKAQNRKEADATFELNWFKFISERVKKLIWLRKRGGSSVEGMD